MAKRMNSVKIVTPETQKANLNGVLNTGVKTTLGNDFVLNDLSDVTVTNPTENDIIFFDGVQWVNKGIDSAMLSYVWVLDGGDVNGHEDDPGPEPEPPEPPEPNTYAEKLTVILYNFINSEEFQNNLKNFEGLNAMSMEGNSINLVISDKFSGLYDVFYNDDDVNSMIGRMVSTIYDNMSKTIRYTLDDIATDVWLDWENFKDEQADEGGFKTKFFIYFSDASIVFYDINVTFIK